jgi:TyrR family helix-turn-helix protein/PAS domain S-box-containing protein
MRKINLVNRENNGSVQEKLKAIMNFDKIINSSLDSLWIADGNGKILQVNQVGLKLYNLSPKDVINKKVDELLEKGIFDRSIIREVIRTEKSHMVINKLKNGKQLLRVANPIFNENGKLTLVIVYERDMTELYLLKSDLEKSYAISEGYRSQLKQLTTQDGHWSKANIRSAIMYKVMEKAVRLSQVDTTILLQGEAGVGKGYFANLIHNASPRKDKPFIRVDAGAIPEQLIESELFGYEGGAFTGALNKGKPGYFEIAEEGTLFLDEIAEIPLQIQVKLLRFLENNQIVRIGDTTTKTINTRVIAATNKRLDKMVEEGKFRKDLFFRLNVIPLSIPPLRERVEDIPPLIYYFLKKFNQKYSTQKAIFPQALECICSYSFPGNIRELSNLIEQLVVLLPSDKIDIEDIPSQIRIGYNNSKNTILTHGWNLQETVAEIEKDLITRAIENFGSQRKAAEPLGIDHSTLSRKIKKYGIRKN